MFNIKITETIGSITKELTSRPMTIRKLKKGFAESKKVPDTVFEGLIEDIKDMLFEDTLNSTEFPDSRQRESPKGHIMTGELLDSVDATVTIRGSKVNLKVGYFIDYGLSLELGGVFDPETVPTGKRDLFTVPFDKLLDKGPTQTTPYHIIEPLFEFNRIKIRTKIYNEISNNFKKGFKNG